MLKAAFVFFILGLLGLVLGAYNFAGLNLESGRTLLLAFLVLAAISFLGSMVTNKKTTNLR